MKTISEAIKGYDNNQIQNYYLYGDDIHIRMEENEQDNKLTEPYNSKSAQKMTKEEMKELIEA